MSDHSPRTVAPCGAPRRLAARTIRRVVASLALASLAALSPSAKAALIQGTWSGESFANGATVTMVADVNLPGFAFDLGPSGGFTHAWWYPTTAFSAVEVQVTGSITPAFNTNFATEAFNWIRIYSNAATPLAALADVTSRADVGASYNVANAPSNSSPATLQLGAVSGSPGEFVASGPVTLAVPEPSAAALLAVVAVGVAGRRRSSR